MTKIAQVVTMPLFSSLHQGPPYLVDIHVTLRPTTRLKHDKREVINELERDDLYIPYHTSRAGRRKAHNTSPQFTSPKIVSHQIFARRYK
jgi:hypothetical protein